MGTPLTDAIEALTTYANEVTGSTTDQTLSDAVYTLAQGYGQGSGDIASLIDRSITSYSDDTITTIGAYAFSNCESLVEFQCENAQYIGDYAFYYCTSLESVNFPKCTNLRQYSFQFCNALKTAVFPAFDETIGGNGRIFSDCTSLKKVDMNRTMFLTNVFNKCTALETVILRRTDGITALNNINNFLNTPFYSGGTGGTIYVPSALISSYQSASNWSTLDGYGTVTWKAIEGSIYETQYADGTPITS